MFSETAEGYEARVRAQSSDPEAVLAGLNLGGVHHERYTPQGDERTRLLIYGVWSEE